MMYAVILMCLGIMMITPYAFTEENECAVGNPCLKTIRRRRECEQGWTEHSGSCYYIPQGKKNFQNAKQDCEDIDGAYLANIACEAENTFIKSLIPNSGDYYWIGLNDINDENNFVWANTNETGNFRGWASGQPDVSLAVQDCVVIVPSGPIGWHDEDCPKSHRYICERSL